MPLCLTLIIIGYRSMVRRAIQGKELRPPRHLGIEAIENEAFGLPSTPVGQQLWFTFKNPYFLKIYNLYWFISLYYYIKFLCLFERWIRNKRVNVLDSEIVVCEFELKPHDYVYFRTYTLVQSTGSLIAPAISSKVPLLFFHKDGFGIK